MMAKWYLGTLGPKASWHLSYRWGKTPEKPHPGNLSRPEIEPGPAVWQARMLSPVPQRWTPHIWKCIVFTVDGAAVQNQTKIPGTQYMAWIPSMSQQMFKVSSMGPMFTQMPINGSKCCVMWVALPVRVRGSVHSCYPLTVSTCLAIHKHHLGLFLEWILEHYASTLLNSYYLQRTQPTLQVGETVVSTIYRENYAFLATR